MKLVYGAEKKSRRQEIEAECAQMEMDRAQFIPVWREIAENFCPTRPRFQITDTQKQNRTNSRIIDSTPAFAVQTLGAGMMGGITSPARPWFRYTTNDPELAEFGSVKQWLWDVQTIISSTFNRSNLYGTFPNMYRDNGAFATSPIGVFEKYDDTVMHNECYPIGSYTIAQDEFGKVNTFKRDYRMTVGQIVKKFYGRGRPSDGEWGNFSHRVKTAYQAGQYQMKIDVTMWVGPNRDHKIYSPWSSEKPFIAIYFEKGCDGNASYASNEGDVVLMEQGYDYFPILCSRWEKNDEDAYGVNCPGMITLGDAKQLQLGERKSLEAVDKSLNPPTVAPTSMRGRENPLHPGSMIFADMREGMQGIRSVYDINFDISKIELKNQQVRERINRGWYADLFLMLSNMEDRDRTAYEVAERKEEKLLALGPVLESVNSDVLDPYMDIAFMTHFKRGLLPPIPEELKGEMLKIEYTSITAQAQKLIGISTMDRFVQSFTAIAAVDPQAKRKFKAAQAVDAYADMLSVNPNVIRSDEEVEAMDRADAAQLQQQQQLMMAQQAAQTAESLAKTPTDGDNALNDLLAVAQAGQ